MTGGTRTPKRLAEEGEAPVTGLDRWQELREAAAAVYLEFGWYDRSEMRSRLGVGSDGRGAPDAAFIAAASPDVVLSLLGVVDRQARQLAAAEARAEPRWSAELREALGVTDKMDRAGETAFLLDLRRRANVAEAELREVRDQLAAVLDECERADDWMRRQYVERNGRGAVPNALEVAALSRLVTAKVRELLWPSSPSIVTLNATQPGVDEHSDSRNATPVTPTPAEPEQCEHGEDEAHSFMERRQRGCELPEGWCPGPAVGKEPEA